MCVCVQVGQGEREEWWIYTAAVCFMVILIFATELYHLEADAKEAADTQRRNVQAILLFVQNIYTYKYI